MKILQITKYFYPAISFGGPVQYTYNLSRYLAKMGHEVTVFTTDALELKTRRRIKEKTGNIDGIDVHYFPNIFRSHGFFISPGLINQIIKEVSQFDVVHLHEYRSFQNMVFYCFRKKVPYVYQIHGEYTYSDEPWDFLILRRIYENLLGNRMINSATKLIAGTKFEASQLINSGVEEEKIAIIPNAIDPDQFKEVSESGLFKNYLNLNNERIILYIGRIHRNKGIDVLLKAFHKVSKELEDVRLVIAGPDDNYLNVLVKIRDQLNLKDKVYFTDLLDRRQVQAAYTDASAVVYASLQEGFPTVLLEAGFFSKPVIVSDHPSMNFIENGKSGMVVQYGNERQLEQTLVKILDNGDFAEKLGRNLNGYVTKKLTWSSISKEIESLYSNLVNN